MADRRTTRFSIEGAELVVVSSAEPSPTAELTPAEQAICRLLSRGAKNSEIAAARGTSVRTVENQVSSILAKFSVSHRAELVRRLAARESE